MNTVLLLFFNNYPLYIFIGIVWQTWLLVSWNYYQIQIKFMHIKNYSNNVFLLVDWLGIIKWQWWLAYLDRGLYSKMTALAKNWGIASTIWLQIISSLITTCKAAMASSHSCRNYFFANILENVIWPQDIVKLSINILAFL